MILNILAVASKRSSKYCPEIYHKNNAIQAMVDKIIVIKDGEIVSDNLNSSKISARLLEDL